jgi:hypothetical protein
MPFHETNHSFCWDEMINQETQEVAPRIVFTGMCIDINMRPARPLPADIRERIVTAFPGSAPQQGPRPYKQEAQ